MSFAKKFTYICVNYNRIKKMRRTLCNMLLLCTALCAALASCDLFKKDEILYDVRNHNIYAVPDSLLNDKTRSALYDFDDDPDVSAKYACLSTFSSVGQRTIVMSGVRSGHLWFKLVDMEQAHTLTEFTSADEVIKTYSWQTSTADYNVKALDKNVYLIDYIQWGTDEVALWRLDGDIESVYKMEFKGRDHFCSFYDPYQRQRACGYGAVYYNDVCYSMAGDTLYLLGYQGKSWFDDMNGGRHNQYAFVAQDEMVSFKFDGRAVHVSCLNLQRDAIVWSVSDQVQNPVEEPFRVHYGISELQAGTWRFDYTVTDAATVITDYSFRINMESPSIEW